MRRVTVLCVGKLKERFYTQAAEEYAKRLGRYCRLEVMELAEQRLSDSPSPAEVERALSREAEALRSKINGRYIALCVEGEQRPSEEFARLLEPPEPLTFVIGGSCGLHPSVKAGAFLRLSMSKMTFPHHLARVMVLEQIYRGFNILEGGRYHK